MPSQECLEASARRLKRSRNRLAWQKRFARRAADPAVRAVAMRMIATLEEVVATMAEAHDLLQRSARADRDGEG